VQTPGVNEVKTTGFPVEAAALTVKVLCTSTSGVPSPEANDEVIATDWKSLTPVGQKPIPSM
jgi:hypothetical protein